MIINYIFQVIVAAIVTAAVSICFNTKASKLGYVMLCGGTGWLTYLIVGNIFNSLIPQYFFATVAITVLSEVFARLLKAPTTVFLVPSLIPLVPGGSLYYTIEFAIKRDFDSFLSKGFSTISIFGAIVIGILIVVSVIKIINTTHTLINNKKSHKNLN